MWKTHDIEHWHKQLLTLRERIDGDFAQVRAEAFRGAGGESGGGLSNTPVHPADLGTQEFDQAVTLGLVENEAMLRQEIENALDRIRAHKYGKCENCATTIPRGRLNAVPYARHCVKCAV